MPAWGWCTDAGPGPARVPAGDSPGRQAPSFSESCPPTRDELSLQRAWPRGYHRRAVPTGAGQRDPGQWGARPPAPSREEALRAPWEGARRGHTSPAPHLRAHVVSTSLRTHACTHTHVQPRLRRGGWGETDLGRGRPEPSPQPPHPCRHELRPLPSSLSLRLAACTLGTGTARATVHAIVPGPRALLSLWPSGGSATGGWLRPVPGSRSSPGAFSRAPPAYRQQLWWLRASPGLSLPHSLPPRAKPLPGPTRCLLLPSPDSGHHSRAVPTLSEPWGTPVNLGAPADSQLSINPVLRISDCAAGG